MGNELRKISGAGGCDVVTAANSPFTARRGRIVAIIPTATSVISSMKEDRKGVITEVTNRSWVGGESSGTFASVKASQLYVPDYPLTEIEVESGEVIVYYDTNPWKHLNIQ
jgi:hypothetical protein